MRMLLFVWMPLFCPYCCCEEHMPKTLYTAEVGRKFHADGSPRLFPGNTLICFCHPATPPYAAALWVQQQLAAHLPGRHYAMLPPASLHMTVMELLCDQVRRPERWSRYLPLDVALVESDAFFIERLANLPPPDRLRMQPVGLSRGRNLMINLQPADAETAAALRVYREDVAAAGGVRFPDHDSYRFHISLAYRIIELSAEQKVRYEAAVSAWETGLIEQLGVFELGTAELVFFDDMFKFVPAAERGMVRSRA